MQKVFLVVVVVVAAVCAHPGSYDDSAEENHIEDHARFYGAKHLVCPYWQNAYGNPELARDHHQDVLSDGTIKGNWKILSPSHQTLETVSYTSKKQTTSETSLNGLHFGSSRAALPANKCPYWENYYGDANVQRSHTQYVHGGATIGEFKLLSPKEGTLQTITYILM